MRKTEQQLLNMDMTTASDKELEAAIADCHFFIQKCESDADSASRVSQSLSDRKDALETVLANARAELDGNP